MFNMKMVVTLCLAGFLSVASVQGQERFQAAGGGDSSAPDPIKRAKIHTELGGLYYSGGNMSVALQELRIAIEAAPGYYQAYSVRGLVYTSLKEYAKAEEDFSKALRFGPEDPQVNNNYGWFLCETGKTKEAIPYFLKALRDPLYETPDRAYANAGACALKSGDQENAERYLLQSLQFSREGTPLVRLQLAGIFFRKGYVEEARRYLNEALKMLEPPPPDALWLGIRLERKMKNRVAEESYASQLRSRYPMSQEYQELLKGNYE
jgi:type IV pilus assembly protein PilF